MLSIVLGRAAIVTIAGIGVGLVLALALMRVVGALLYGVQPTDAPTFAMVSAVIAIVSIGASVIPARRATRVDPLIALRTE